MVVVGTDVHKRTHTFVAVDEVGRKLGEKVVAATTAGTQGAGLGSHRVRRRSVVGIEDCRNLSARWSATCSPRGSRWCGWRRS